MTLQTAADDIARLVSVIDVTLLEEAATKEDILSVCEKAKDAGAASVCILPKWVSTAKEALAGSKVTVCTVANFPHGEDSDEDVVAEALQAKKDGADEIDVVVPYSILKHDDGFAIKTLISEVVQACPKTVIKAILETGALENRTQILKAAGSAAAGGADFIKTSTGHHPVGATPESVAILLDFLEMYPGKIGLKVSGKISTAEIGEQYWIQAEEKMGEQWCHKKRFRLGSSTLLDDLTKEM